ncbi:alkaline phosphatase family protein [Paraburkholderia sp. J12]|uniref:phospholipase C n=1 Tax=Paraburkholderia sp. J12 TaxID=2805432 RepID=UPI002ABE8F14|nr:alkaline phosphatase family protein [Paraburkholderia sp. J12]
MNLRKTLLSVSFAAAVAAIAACGNSSNSSNPTPTAAVSPQDALQTSTPIKHVVVIFGENESFDHYFGTYPNAQNPEGEPVFSAATGTPAVNGLTSALLTNNPTVSNTSNPKGTNINPFRLDRSQAATESQNHNYTPEQLAADGGKMDAFPLNTGDNAVGSANTFGEPGLVMGYFDGNTVTALWNYAQHFAMSDNAYTDTYGPSSPGAISVVSGQHNGAVVTSKGAVVAGSATSSPSTSVLYDLQGGWTLVGDLDPTGDACTVAAGSTTTAGMTSKNIGDLLNSASITWGGFMGGFNLQTVNANGTTGCNRSTYSSVLGANENDYVQHHAWFQYYKTTQNLAHTRPSSVAAIGYTDPLDNTATPVHHQYDVNDFFAAVQSGNFPSVSFLKAPAVADAHPGNSDPLDEQSFVTSVVNFLQQQPDWKNTAVIVTYDDSDGWYDHQYVTPTTSSFDSTSAETTGQNVKVAVTGADQLNGPGVCNAAGAVQGVGVNGGAVNGRCGPGTRIPFLVISPYAKANYVDSSTVLTQASVVRFIEDNWLGGSRIGQGSNDANAGSIMNLFNFAATTPNAPLYLDSNQGTPLTAPPAAITGPSL